MQLTERHIINNSHSLYKECDELCFKSKNLYNYALYLIKQEINKTIEEKEKGLRENIHYLNYYDINKIMIQTQQPDYVALPRKVSNQTLMALDRNWKSFFKSIRDYKKNSSKYYNAPKPPKYLHKICGRFLTTYEKGTISKTYLKNNIISLSGTNIKIKTKQTNINQVRIVPLLDQYVIEVIYTKEDVIKLSDNQKYLSIDLGINNLATITTNIKKIKPLIINGKPLKSINQYYNKHNSELKSILEKRNKKKQSKQLNKLTIKRNNKINDYLHKASRHIVSLAKEKEINTIIIGKNENWKQNSNIGKKNNQNFVNIPHSRFISMIRYKSEKEGINIILQEESYTSKASFFNLDEIPTYKKSLEDKYSFSGYRVKRGLYKLKDDKRTINADVNGSYNILRKAIPNVFADGIEGFAVIPEIIKISNKFLCFS